MGVGGGAGTPGDRTGQAATTFDYQGTSVLLLFGGELHHSSTKSSLSNEVFTGFFQVFPLDYSCTASYVD